MTNDNFWTELSMPVLPEAAEAVAEVLQELTGAGVAIEPTIEALGPDEGYTLDNDAPLILHAYIFGSVSPSRRATLRRRLNHSGLPQDVLGPITWQTIRE